MLILFGVIFELVVSFYVIVPSFACFSEKILFLFAKPDHILAEVYMLAYSLDRTTPRTLVPLFTANYIVDKSIFPFFYVVLLLHSSYYKSSCLDFGVYLLISCFSFFFSVAFTYFRSFSVDVTLTLENGCVK